MGLDIVAERCRYIPGFTVSRIISSGFLKIFTIFSNDSMFPDRYGHDELFVLGTNLSY
ncbi:hypothetical protein LEP1GSC194_1326 [Leptospira alstonii serovar Sichuan str. 79601]|uniref:Uncharacterized protein n=1 Tax=Leptospira alstonii serovar Sichuan str. 79601 TaxID=1218565 RepID=M6CPZ1_9LEPT|nr:hypothetical protein LEP1GSC194_1326 [Leptospira alstonii serovar Sichuan str. 79601]